MAKGTVQLCLLHVFWRLQRLSWLMTSKAVPSMSKINHYIIHIMVFWGYLQFPILLEGSRRLFYPLLFLCRPSSLWGRVVKDEIAESPLLGRGLPLF